MVLFIFSRTFLALVGGGWPPASGLDRSRRRGLEPSRTPQERLAAQERRPKRKNFAEYTFCEVLKKTEPEHPAANLACMGQQEDRAPGVGPAGVEPATLRLKGACSAIELRARG